MQDNSFNLFRMFYGIVLIYKIQKLYSLIMKSLEPPNKVDEILREVSLRFIEIN